MDGVIRTTDSDFWEFGAIEGGGSFEGTTATKWLTDSLKLKRVLRDMLIELHKDVEDDKVRHIQTVGILTGGLRAQLFRCWAPHRDGVIICESVGRVEQFPRLAMTLHKHLWGLLAMVDVAVSMVADTMAVILGHDLAPA
jgi:hypothetical protein